MQQDRKHGCNAFAQMASIQDHVEASMFQQEFAALEALREGLPHRLLDHAGPCEPNECIWLCGNNIA